MYMCMKLPPNARKPIYATAVATLIFYLINLVRVEKKNNSIFVFGW